MEKKTSETSVWGTTRTMEEVVGANLTRFREREGISRAELGRRIGAFANKPWSRQAVSLAEAGKRAFGVTDLVTISYSTGLTMTDLLAIPEDVDHIELGAEIPILAVSVSTSMELSALTREKRQEYELEGRYRAVLQMEKYVGTWAANVKRALDGHKTEPVDTEGGEH
ncbi:helix-turn-helix transcriptional regulator [Kocuria sp. M1N1S27]|uniref:helix-turn-helix transcriptional regulator n=1 Tax=Kocuria kalidii TaxID=3376283 RepID=UPI0037A1DBEC